MANILYYSVHEPLEFDDIQLFRKLGHCIFPLGVHSPHRPQANPFRLSVYFGQELERLTKRFVETGCRYEFNNRTECLLTESFLKEFDVIIIVHDIFFINKNWDKLKDRPVIWRTIGQAIDDLDRFAEPLRCQGLKIVRWSSRESGIPGYIGHDAVIRAYKDPKIYGDWEGQSSNKIITFCSAFKQRYPSEYEFFKASVNGLEYLVGGGSNPDVEHAIGLLDFDDQRNLLRSSRCYLYVHGSEIPYTLNFIEAWITGIPVIALSRDADIDLNFRYNEINDFITSEENGYLVRDCQECGQLLADLTGGHVDSSQVGAAARTSAVNLFGINQIAADWQAFLETLGITPPSADPQMGYTASAVGDDPDLHLRLAGERIEPESVSNNTYAFTLATAPAGSVILASRSGVPALLGLNQDHRQLGVAIKRIEIRLPRATLVFPHDSYVFDQPGCYGSEGTFNWTNGKIELPAWLFKFTFPLTLTVQIEPNGMRYPLSPADRTSPAGW